MTTIRQHHFALFDSALGRCALTWTEAGIAGVLLPEASEARLRERLLRRFRFALEAIPPAAVQEAIEAIGGLLRGMPDDLRRIVLDLHEVPPFHARVYAETRAIPPGATLSYGELARRVGASGWARAVGQALGRNPFAIVVPCHRVLAAGHRSGGFSAPGGVQTKLRLLDIEAGMASEPLLASAAGTPQLALPLAVAR